MLIHNPPIEITGNLMMLGTDEYPLYLFKDGDEAILFEGSVGVVGRLAADQMAESGVVLESIKQLVVPHAHPDHVMAVPLFKELCPGITVVASEAAAGVLAAEKAVSFFCKIDGALTAFLLKNGEVEEKHRISPPADMVIPVDRTIGEGDTLTAGDSIFNVLATPGHSHCSLSFHEEDKGILIVSDAASYYMPEGDYWWPNYFTSYPAYVDSITRLAALNAEVLCLGHHGVITGTAGVAAHFGDALAATEAYHQRIVDEVKAGISVRALAEQLGKEVYQKTQLLPLDFFQKNCGLVIKQSLKHEGITGEE
jgi:glyoxylase-like metal-dependent hydrolase (beta-lactamase superfamily II)